MSSPKYLIFPQVLPVSENKEGSGIWQTILALISVWSLTSVCCSLQSWSKSQKVIFYVFTWGQDVKSVSLFIKLDRSSVIQSQSQSFCLKPSPSLATRLSTIRELDIMWRAREWVWLVMPGKVWITLIMMIMRLEWVGPGGREITNQLAECQSPGLIQSEASIEVTWSLLTHQQATCQPPGHQVKLATVINCIYILHHLLFITKEVGLLSFEYMKKTPLNKRKYNPELDLTFDKVKP